MQLTLHAIDELPLEQIRYWDWLVETADAARSPFLTYAFCRTIGTVRGSVYVLQIVDEQSNVGFLPFQFMPGRAFFGHGEKVGGSMSDIFGIIGRFPTKLDPSELLKAARLSSLRFDHGVGELCPFYFTEPEKSAGVRVEVKDFANYASALTRNSKDFVKNVERAQRQLVRDIGEVQFEWQASDTVGELDRLIANKRRQYRRTGVADGLSAEWRRKALYRLLEQAPTLNCHPVLSTLYANGEWVASNLSLGCHDTLHIWYPAYDIRFRRYSPGHILFFKLLEYASAQGFRIFDFGEGEADYKYKYQGTSYDLWKGVIRRKSALGHSDRVFQSLQWRAERLCTALRAWRLRQQEGTS